MLNEDDYEDEPIETAAGTGEYIETTANEAIEALNRGPASGEIEDAIGDFEVAIDEIRRQQEAAKEAVDRLTGSTYGAGGVHALADGADEAYDQLEEIRAMSRSMVAGLTAASAGGESAAEATITLDGTEYRLRVDPLEEAETGEPIDDSE